MIFTITSYSAFDRTIRTTFREAAEVAERFARGVGDLPSTITDQHGCRWIVWAGAQPQLMDCPAVAAGNRCDCDSNSYDD
jgi:hypothetical protein